jgi:hypothetical protein
MHKASPESHRGQFACEVAPARRRVSHPPHKSAKSHLQHPHRTMPVLSFLPHHPGSVPRRINGEAILTRGVFLVSALFRYISCIFCVLYHSSFLVSFFPFTSCVTKSGDGILIFLLGRRTHYLNNEWHRRRGVCGTSMEDVMKE